LLDETRRAGIVVCSTVTGDVTRLNAGLTLAGYRIVQEALTNVRRHARATRTWVEIRCASQTLEIDVRDDGAGPVKSARAGHGLIGMRERVLLYGGDLSVGPVEGGGYRVRVVLPVQAGA
jgi:signal transduction histidine kinase